MRSKAVAAITYQPRPLDILRQSPEVIAIILETMPMGIYQGMLIKEMPFMPNIAPGLFSWAYRMNYLGEKLATLGWSKSEDKNQPHLYSPTTDSMRICLTLFAGDFEGDIFLSRARGPATTRFVNSNNPWNLQKTFEFGEQYDLPREVNIVIVCHRDHNKMLTVLAIVPTATNSNNTKLICGDREELGRIDLKQYENPTLQDMPRPESEINAFVLLDKRNGTND